MNPQENKILPMLEKVRSTGAGKYIACCPAHDDSDPSLALYFNHDGRVLIHCYAGCTPIAIMESIGLTMTDLFPDRIAHYLPGGTDRHPKREGHSAPRHRTVLEIADEMRAKGEKLTPSQLEEERAAFLALRSLG